jgi:hypothetical protein
MVDRIPRDHQELTGQPEALIRGHARNAKMPQILLFLPSNYYRKPTRQFVVMPPN